MSADAEVDPPKGEPAAEDELDEELLREEEVEDVNESAEPLEIDSLLSYFGTDFDVHGLVRRLNEGEVIVPNFDPDTGTGSAIEGFQRRFVWKRYQMDRFVESLLLEYPVPSIFLVQQSNKKMLVLDGQQRLRTLQQFYAGKTFDGEAFRLASVENALKGIAYDELPAENKRTLDNTFIHAIIVRYDPSPEGARNVYQLFERLNTGGTNLYPQEIRVALYMGDLVRLLRDLNANADWRLLYGRISDRLKDQELILRFLAFEFGQRPYSRPLKQYLNDFLSDHRELQGLNSTVVTKKFEATTKAIARGIGSRAFRVTNAVNAALVDSIMVGVATRLDSGPITDFDSMKAAHQALLKNESFTTAIGRATADEERVRTRLLLARKAFADVA
jgi:hypothetical protein